MNETDLFVEDTTNNLITTEAELSYAAPGQY